MKILMVSPYPVYPPVFGGQARIFEIAKNLSRLGNDVTILANHHGAMQTREMEIDGITIKNFRSSFQDIAIFFHNKFGIPLIVSYPFHRIFAQHFKYLFNEKYDVIEFEQPFLATWMSLLPQGTLKIYSSQNVEVDFDIEDQKKSMFYPFYKKLLSTCEAEALRLSNHIITVSKEDKERLTKFYETSSNKISVVENGFEPLKQKINKATLRKKLGIKRTDKVAVFIGSKTLPNLNCIKEITENIAPKNKDIIFLLMGSATDAYVKKHPNVINLGLVDNPDDYLQVGNLGLLPVYQGSGTNIKLLNYLKLGLPVLSTQFGIRGYREFKKYVTLSTIDQFPEKVSKIRKFNVPKTLLERYTWENLVKKLEYKYKELLS